MINQQQQQRWLALYLPHWAVDRCRRRQAKELKPTSLPYLLTNERAQQELVMRCCPLAQQAGALPGLPLPLARALVPDAVVAPFQAEADLKALQHLALKLLKFTPLVALDSELVSADRHNKLTKLDSKYWGLMLDLGGTTRLYHNRPHPAEEILRNLKAAGIEARIGCAPTAGCAWALARHGTRALNLAESEKPIDILAPLSPAALRLPKAMLEGLHELGLDTIKQIFQLPRRKLLERFGLPLLQRMDQALGLLPEPLEFSDEPSCWSINTVFLEPLLNQQQLAIAITTLLSRLCDTLTKTRQQARLFLVKFEYLNKSFGLQHCQRELTLASGINSMNELSSVIGPLAESLCLERGAVSLEIEAQFLENQISAQSDLRDSNTATTTPSDNPQAARTLLNTLTLRLGAQNLKRLKYENAHLPEHSYTYQPLDSPSQPPANTALEISFGERPSYILSPPERIEAIALLPDKPPAAVLWHGQRYKIISGRGPERIAAEWWRGLVAIPPNKQEYYATEARDYFTIQDELGRWLWVFRSQPSGRWYLQGLWT